MYPEDSLFQLNRARDNTGDDYNDDGNVQVDVLSSEQTAADDNANTTFTDKENVNAHQFEGNGPLFAFTSSNATDDNAPNVTANIALDLIAAEASNNENSTGSSSSKPINQDLFKKPDGSPSPPAPQPAVLIEMLNFELSLTFTEPQRRYLRYYASSHRRRAQSQARNTVVKNALTTYFNNIYLDELSDRHYTPLDQVVVNNGGSEHVIVSKSRFTGELFDLTSSSVWSGVAIFRNVGESKSMPTEFAVQAIQLQALGDEDGVLLSSLRDADAEGVTGIDRLESIKASILPFPTDTNRISGGESLQIDQTHSLDQSITTSQQPAEINSVVFTAVIVASMSFVLLAFTLFVAFRRSQMPLHQSTNNENQQGQDQWKVRDARPDEIPPTYSGGLNTIASSDSPVRGIHANTDGEDADDEMSLPEEMPVASVDPSDGASVSAFSDVSSLGNVIQNAIQAYQSNIDVESSTPDSHDTFFRRLGTDDGEESVGIASIDDSSQLEALSLNSKRGYMYD